MSNKNQDDNWANPDTLLVTSGRNPHDNFGFVNPPVYHGSTVLFPTTETFLKRDQKYLYGRRGTPTSDAFETAITEIHGGYGTKATSSGLAAITLALLSVVQSGDHILVTDSTYRPTRFFCDGMLKRFGVETTYYDPLVGPDIEALIRPNTKLIYTECPGSLTMDVQDIPAICKVAQAHDCIVLTDNTWSTPLFFDAFGHGVDIVVQAGTKYVVGHSDVMMGTVTVKEQYWPQIRAGFDMLGQCVGPDDLYLALRGLRTMGVRLERHMHSALSVAQWLESRPEVARVLHPALPSFPGYEIWKRDFTGSSGLFSVLLKPVSDAAFHACLDGFQLFGMGASWGGYESLALPFDPASHRTIPTWDHDGPAVRFHIGLEAVEDLLGDLEAGFERMAANA